MLLVHFQWPGGLSGTVDIGPIVSTIIVNSLLRKHSAAPAPAASVHQVWDNSSTFGLGWEGGSPRVGAQESSVCSVSDAIGLRSLRRLQKVQTPVREAKHGSQPDPGPGCCSSGMGAQ